MKAMIALRIIGWVVLGICLATVLAFVVGVPVMLLWNWLMPALTRGAAAEMTYPQAVGFFLLCHILFKSHHEKHAHDERGRRQPRLLARKIRGLLAGGGSEGGQPEAVEGDA